MTHVMIYHIIVSCIILVVGDNLWGTAKSGRAIPKRAGGLGPEIESAPASLRPSPYIHVCVCIYIYIYIYDITYIYIYI